MAVEDQVRVLRDDEKQLLSDPNAWKAGIQEKAELYAARVQVLGSVIGFGEALDISPSAQAELVHAFRLRGSGMTFESAEEMARTFNNLVFSLPSAKSDEVDTFNVLPGILPDTPALPAGDVPTPTQEKPPLVEPSTPSPETQKSRRRTTTKQSAVTKAPVRRSKSEKEVNPNALDDSALEALEALVGKVDTKNLTIRDAGRLTEFFVAKAADSDKKSSYEQYYRPLLMKRFSNISRARIAIHLAKKPQDISNIFSTLKATIRDNYTTEELAKLLQEELDIPQKPWTRATQESEVIEAPKSAIVPAIVESPQPIQSPSVSAVRPAITDRSDRSKSGPTYGDVVTLLEDVVKPKDEEALGRLQAYLTTNMATAESLRDGDINRITYAIKEGLRKKYGSFDNAITALGLTEAERVALQNVLGIIRVSGGPQRSTQAVSVAKYIHPDGKAVHFEREDATKSALVKVATGLSEGARP